MVPFGPRLDFITSCRPFAALMFMKSAAALDMISALGLTDFRLEDAMMVGGLILGLFDVLLFEASRIARVLETGAPGSNFDWKRKPHTRLRSSRRFPAEQNSTKNTRGPVHNNVITENEH